MNLTKSWSETEVNILKNNYGKISAKKISELLLTRTQVAVHLHAAKLGLKSNIIVSRQKYSYNENFWSVPNQLNCYWAGIFAADACVGIYKGASVFHWFISSKDFPHMELFKNSINSNHPITFRNQKSPNSNAISEMCAFRLCSKQWLKDLSYFYNIIPNKTKRLAPLRIMNDYLEWCYIIGLIDGDGCISLIHDKLNNRKILRFQYTSSSENILKWVCNKIEKLIKYNYRHNQEDRIHQLQNKKCSVYCVSGLKASLLIDYLSKFPVPKLARKWENLEVLSYITKHKDEYPERFRELDEYFSKIK